MTLNDFLTPDEQKSIVEAIAQAERMTSGEIRVHVTPRCWGNALKRARKVFDKLEMYKTRERNGMLIYLAFKSRKFAIMGDVGINELLPDNYWDSERDLLASHLSAGTAAQGIIEVIGHMGDKLKEHFPHQDDDENELSNEISYED